MQHRSGAISTAGGLPQRREARHLSSQAQRWRAWLDWLGSPDIPARHRVIEALNHAPLPGSLCAHFACACAERALSQMCQSGHRVLPSAFELLAQKRASVEGQDEAPELLDKDEQPEDKGWQMAYTCVHASPTQAARYAARWLRGEEQARWMCQELQRRLRGLLHQRARLLSALQQLQLHRDGTLQKRHKQLEEVLFGS